MGSGWTDVYGVPAGYVERQHRLDEQRRAAMSPEERELDDAVRDFNAVSRERDYATLHPEVAAAQERVHRARRALREDGRRNHP